MGTTKTALAVLVVLGLAVTTVGLEGENGYDASLLVTLGDVHGNVTYIGSYGVTWQSLAYFSFWAPGIQTDALACDSSGNLYSLVMGRNANTGSFSEYTGLIRHDGTDFEHLVQARMDFGTEPTRTGEEITAVVVSPTSSGGLTAGHPVIVRQRVYLESGQPAGTVEIATVDPDTGIPTVLHSFDEGAWSCRVAIDGTGSSTDGTIYVGPMQDGSIAKLTYSSGFYSESTVPGSFVAGDGLLIQADGDLLTFQSTASWYTLSWPYDDQVIYKIDPATGAATSISSVEGRSFIFDWTLDADGKLWMGLRMRVNKKRTYHYLAEAVVGGVTDVDNRVSSSDADPYCIAAGPDGKFFLLESYTYGGEIWVLSPGSGGGGKPPKKK